MSAEPCTIGILFGDVAGSTRLYETWGDAVAHEAVQNALNLMAGCVMRCGGVVVKTVGDEIMGAFFRIEPMIEAAVEMQRICAKAGTERASGGKSGPSVKLRVGMHFGPALRSGADYFGQTVNSAARMVSLAKADEIITATDIRELVGAREQALFRPLEAFRLRGASDDVGLAEIVWHQTSQLTELPVLQQGGLLPIGGGKLVLELGTQKWSIDPRDPPFQIGREPENTLCIPDSRVSRRHATLERRVASWVLLDHSSNGTFVTFGTGREMTLRRHELVLHGQGLIRFGQSGTHSDAPVLKFGVFSG
jgi:class 3 adenylate cyclase